MAIFAIFMLSLPLFVIGAGVIFEASASLEGTDHALMVGCGGATIVAAMLLAVAGLGVLGALVTAALGVAIAAPLHRAVSF